MVPGEVIGRGPQRLLLVQSKLDTTRWVGVVSKEVTMKNILNLTPGGVHPFTKKRPYSFLNKSVEANDKDLVASRGHLPQ